MQDEITITINNTNEAQVSHKYGNIVQYKNVHLKDIVEELVKANKIGTGLLPHNTLFFQGTGVKYSVGIKAPGRIKRFIYRDKSYNIPLPDCLFIINVDNTYIQNSYLYSTISFNSSSRLYHFPFGNVYDDGRICWGYNQLPRITDKQQLDGVVITFFDSPYNGDLYTTRYNGEGLFLPQLLNKLKKLKQFPNQLLKNHGAKTIGGL